MECKQAGCEKEAVAIVHWPGKESEQCEEHCRQLDGLSKMMGWGNVVFTSLETGLTMGFQPKE